MLKMCRPNTRTRKSQSVKKRTQIRHQSFQQEEIFKLCNRKRTERERQRDRERHTEREKKKKKKKKEEEEESWKCEHCMLQWLYQCLFK